MQSNVSFDIILSPTSVKFFVSWHVEGWLLFEQKMVFLCLRMQIKIFFDYDVIMVS